MKELAIPAVRQAKCFTCGPAALLSAFRYLGVARRSTEASLAREMGTRAEDGTTVDAMIECARRRWPRADLVQGLTYEDLRARVARGDVCILIVQAWRDDPNVPWVDDFRDGHYVVLTAVGRRNAYLVPGPKSVSPREQRRNARVERMEILWSE